VCSQRLMNEICDEKRFGKSIKAGLAELRNGIHDGLFTAHGEEENWAIAHRTLVPAFGPLNINGMFDDMKDIVSDIAHSREMKMCSVLTYLPTGLPIGPQVGKIRTFLCDPSR